MRPPQINMLDNPVYQDQWVINGHCSAEKNSAHLHCVCSWLAHVSEGGHAHDRYNKVKFGKDFAK
jgi:hypothetical protein